MLTADIVCLLFTAEALVSFQFLRLRQADPACDCFTCRNAADYDRHLRFSLWVLACSSLLVAAGAIRMANP